MSARCGARRQGEYPTAHTCDDPLACALGSLVDGDDPTEVELGRLHELLDRVEELCEGSRAKVAREILFDVHRERGGPR